MDAIEAPGASDGKTAWAPGEVAFLVFLLLVLIAVSGLGVLAYREAMKTELTKRNGEQWANWLTQESTKRFLPGYEHAACAGRLTAETKPASGAEALAAPGVPTDGSGTWEACLNYLTTQTAFKDMRNPFTDKAPVFIAACDPADHSLAGSFAMEKALPNPPGSAVPTVTSTLAPADSIADKVHLKITVCDKGSYAIKIAEFDF